METYIWLFPLIFIFHDMEEIIGLRLFLQRNEEMLSKRYPFILKTYHDFSTEGFALAVLEEFIVCTVFSIMAFYTNTEFFKLLWLGGFIACTLHFVIHIVQAVIIRQYIPALITSILCLPVSIRIISTCISILECRTEKIVLFGFIGIIIVALNLKFAQSLIGWYTRKTGRGF